MSSRKQQPTNRYESSLLKCRNCNARGALTLGQTDAPRYVCISGDFHLETGRSAPDSSTIVCNQCDEVWGDIPAGEKAS
jgi:hypothetical protein